MRIFSHTLLSVISNCVDLQRCKWCNPSFLLDEYPYMICLIRSQIHGLIKVIEKPKKSYFGNDDPSSFGRCQFCSFTWKKTGELFCGITITQPPTILYTHIFIPFGLNYYGCDDLLSIRQVPLSFRSSFGDAPNCRWLGERCRDWIHTAAISTSSKEL